MTGLQDYALWPVSVVAQPEFMDLNNLVLLLVYETTCIKYYTCVQNHLMDGKCYFQIKCIWNEKSLLCLYRLLVMVALSFISF